MRCYIIVLLCVVSQYLLSQTGISLIAKKPGDTVIAYVPTLIFSKDTILPTIKILSKRENQHTLHIMIVTGDSLKDPRETFYISAPDGGFFVSQPHNKTTKDGCYFLAYVDMVLYKRYNFPIVRSCTVRYYKENYSPYGDFNAQFKPNKTIIPIEITNE